VTIIARICVLAILTLAVGQRTTTVVAADCYDCPATAIRVPLTKAYRIQPGFCPQQLVSMIQRCVPVDGSCAGCGPYGIPPIYAVGNSVVVRQTPEGHERIAKYLSDLGVFVPPQVSQAAIRTES